MKPTIEEVLKYAKPQIANFIAENAGDLPQEQREEIFQEANLRLIKVYPGLEEDGGWKSYVYNHCRGAVLDYLKFGVGFQESKWSLAKPEEHGSRNVNKIRDRLSLRTHDDESDRELGSVLGENGMFSLTDHDSPRINWDLLARMATLDIGLHAFLKWLRGFSVEEMAPTLGLCRARVGQVICEFLARFDDPEMVSDPGFCQIIWGLGLAKRFGIEDRDQSEVFGCNIGWPRTPVDLDSTEPKFKTHQMDLFCGTG